MAGYGLNRGAVRIIGSFWVYTGILEYLQHFSPGRHPALWDLAAIAIPGSTGGIWLTTDVFPRLGMAEKINVKSTPRGTAATDMVAAGEADIAVMPVSEILHAAGVDFVGTIPPEIQLAQVFSAAVVAGSREIEAPKRLIEFLASARASETIRKSGMEPLVTLK